VFAADIGAYFAGHRFGRVKLAPQVSPGKTWEGLIGGVLLAALTSGAGGLLVGLPPGVMVPVGLGVSALSVVGDLTESMFKRSVGAKDSGHLIPGHGGVLDRIDGITAAMPFFALALSWLGLVTG
jgi:phosphatidate cytidylyltransferase